MVIDMFQRIRAIERALRDVIIPAIDPNMANAVEQAGYCVRHLGLMTTHSNWEYPFELAELRDFLALTEHLQNLAGTAAPPNVREQALAAATAAQGLAVIRLPALNVVKDAVRELRQAAEGLLKAALDSGPTVGNAAGAAVLEMAKRREIREGPWMRGQGYDNATQPALDMAQALEL